MAVRKGCLIGQKMSYRFSFCCLNGPCTRRSIYFNVSELLRNFNSKSQQQMFLLRHSRHFCVLLMDTNMASPYKKLYKFRWHTSANSSQMKNNGDLILGEVVYIAIIYHIRDSWIFYWMVTIFILITWLVKTENKTCFFYVFYTLIKHRFLTNQGAQDPIYIINGYHIY